MIKAESSLMRLFRLLGMEKVAWSLRRIYCPVSSASLVLEVGSGGNPYARANVLLDAYESTRERHWVPLKSDRPTVLGFVERLPFRDGIFDFVIASHVLEHSSNPELFLRELQRVAKAGYIEVPDAFMERINPYRDHRLEVTIRHGTLIIRKKQGSVVDFDLVELYSEKAKSYVTKELMPSRPFAFHVRYYWQDTIDFKVVNPEVDASWRPPLEEFCNHPSLNPKTIKQHLLNGLRFCLSQRERNRRIDLLQLLQCPTCNSAKLTDEKSHILCNSCKTNYPFSNGLPQLFDSKRLNEIG